MDRFASCAKSAVSIQEQTCHKQACVQLKRRWQELFQGFNGEQNRFTNQEQLIGEISRLKRKLAITQKSKHLFSDELSIIKEQLQITKNKLKFLKETKNVQQQLSLSQLSSCEEKTNRIVIKQREQQIEILVTTLKEKNRQLQNFKTKNIQLIDQINSKNNILSKIHESTNSQFNFYRREITQLQENLQLKNKELENKQKWFARTLEKEREEWSKAKKNMQIRLIQKESELQELLEKEKKFEQIINDLQQKIKTIQQMSINQKEENIWLKKVMQEAKIEYIHNQLVKLEQRDKKTKENQEKKKRANIAQLSKHLKSNAMMSTGLPSAKTYRVSNNSSTSYIAPFRLTPQDLNLSQLQPALERSQVNQF